MNSLLGNREYLFDQVPALMNILEGVHTLDEMAEYLPKMSLVNQGLLGKPMAPMLVIAGVTIRRYRSPTIPVAQQGRRAQRRDGSTLGAVILAGKWACGPIPSYSRK